MDALSGISCLSPSSKSLFHNPSLKPRFRRHPPQVSVSRASSNPARELAENDVLRIFLKERVLNGDFISKASHMFWLREVMKAVDFDAVDVSDPSQEANQVMKSQDDGGFLKLTRTQEWISGADSAPMNKKAAAKAMQDDSDKRKMLNFLNYEALKRELMLLSVGIGTACTGYCLIALSVQAAISYAIGVCFSCLYLQLLCKHADNLSKEMIPSIFMKRKSKKYHKASFCLSPSLIFFFFTQFSEVVFFEPLFYFSCPRIGIRSEDLSDSLERSIRGSGIALSSPRLVIPAAVYGLWALSHHYFSSDIFDFQIVPAMFGLFVYKAAALVQVYRDNEDLKFIFPENAEGSRD